MVHCRHFGTVVFGEQDGPCSDAPAGTDHKHLLIRLNMRDTEKVQGVDTADRNRHTFVEADAVRLYPHWCTFGTTDILGIASHSHAGRSEYCNARLKSGYIASYLLDDSRELHPRDIMFRFPVAHVKSKGYPCPRR